MSNYAALAYLVTNTNCNVQVIFGNTASYIDNKGSRHDGVEFGSWELFAAGGTFFPQGWVSGIDDISKYSTIDNQIQVIIPKTLQGFVDQNHFSETELASNMAHEMLVHVLFYYLGVKEFYHPIGPNGAYDTPLQLIQLKRINANIVPKK